MKRRASSRKLRVLVLMHEDLVPPASIEGLNEKEVDVFRTEYDVVTMLRKMGHEVQPLGVAYDLGVLRSALDSFNPHITFNVLEEFHGVPVYDHHVVGFLELMKRRYTGCNPRGLMLAHDKALSKKILAYHRVPVPDFIVFELGQKARKPRRLSYPLMVKSLTEEGSVGIAQASVVNDDDGLRERVEFLQRQLRTDVIAEQYVEGRELYVGLLGNHRVRRLPIWELLFTKMPDDVPHIATEKVKWDLAYRKKRGIKAAAAKDLPVGAEQRIDRLCKRAYRALNLTGYARLDLRMTDDGRLYLLEANPNPQLSDGDEFAAAARAAGMSYEKLLDEILKLGLGYRAQWQEA
ncbi:MAG TPA: ATP-grasp domain-containing protein [Candidatus Polarisedimenticolaceae bacterium]|nr:ATP-grasp domain-containing protein [Candidatus Polarisedimenticolaceae bacterium]